MTTIPTLAGFTAKEKITAVKLTQHTKTAVENSKLYKPFAYIAASAAQSMPGATTKSTLDVTVYDNDDMADTVNSQLVIRTAGLYRITFSIAWAANSTGFRAVFLYITTGTPIAAVAHAAGTKESRQHGSWTARLSVGDTIEIRGGHGAGAALNTVVDLGGSFLTAEWMSL